MNIRSTMCTALMAISIIALPQAQANEGQYVKPEAAQAESGKADPAKILVYISPEEYKHPIKLWHFYYSYWFEQGELVESAATHVLGNAYGDVGMCEGNKAGNTLVWLRPSMFYNPHMRTFYGKVTAFVYSGSGKPLGTFVGESQKTGWLDVQPARSIESTYALAIENLVGKLKADPALQTVITQGIPANETLTPCSMVTVLPMSKTPAM